MTDRPSPQRAYATLFASFLRFDVSFAIRVILGSLTTVHSMRSTTFRTRERTTFAFALEEA